MTRCFLWLVVGAFTAIAMVGAYKKIRERHDEEDVDALVDRISAKLDQIEATL